MQRQIDLLDELYLVTILDQPGGQCLQVGNGKPGAAKLVVLEGCRHSIQLGDQKEEIQMAIQGETAYIRAFGRTFTLTVLDPVDQAAREAGGNYDIALAPMPGMVVQIHVEVGDRVKIGQPMLTIESMKILTMIMAPRDGEVSRIHFEPGEPFDKNAVLVSLEQKKETCKENCDAPH